MNASFFRVACSYI